MLPSWKTLKNPPERILALAIDNAPEITNSRFKRFTAELQELIRARFPIIQIATHEEERALAEIEKIAKELKHRLMIWSSVAPTSDSLWTGLRSLRAKFASQGPRRPSRVLSLRKKKATPPECPVLFGNGGRYKD